jgi:hypothetical protein
LDEPGFGPFLTVETYQEATMNNQHERRLMLRGEIVALLQLPDHKIQTLVDTRQILPIRIEGEERFDSKDVYQLIDVYKATASRRTSNAA